MLKRYYACVYGGASDAISDTHKEKVKKLGNLIAENGFSLVYGGGATGCMGAVARGVSQKDGYVMGISPYFISEFEDIYQCDNTVMVDTMEERKMLMEKHADIFFIVPGGVGTMDEFFQVLTLKYLKRITAPIVIVNIGGFYNTLLALIDDLASQGAISGRIYTMFDVIDDIGDNISQMLKNIRGILN